MNIAKLYTDKSAITAADLLNDRAIPFVDALGIRLNRILTDRGAESVLNMGRGKPQNHAYLLYLAVEDIDHSRTEANHPQTNGICQRLHQTLQDESAGGGEPALQEETVPEPGGVAGGPGRLARQLQPGASPLGTILPREDSLGDLPAK